MEKKNLYKILITAGITAVVTVVLTLAGVKLYLSSLPISLSNIIKTAKIIESSYVGEYDADKMEDEMGDIFFATVNLARWHKIDAEQALLRANKKFTKRFKKMEELADKPLEAYSYEEFDALWKRAKILVDKD